MELRRSRPSKVRRPARSSCRRRLRSRAAHRSCTAWCAGSWPSAGRHAQDQGPFARSAARPAKKIVRQKGTGRARHGNARRRSSAAAARRSVRSPRPRHRSAEEGARAGAEACAVGQGQGKLIVSTMPRLPKPRPRLLKVQLAKLGLSALIIDGAERSTTELRARGAQHAASTCCRCRASTSTTSCAATRWC
jgi:hypothetical protein